MHKSGHQYLLNVYKPQNNVTAKRFGSNEGVNPILKAK